MTPNSGEYILLQTVAPATAPVTTAESKADLKIEHTDEDALIESLIQAATAFTSGPDGVTGKALVTQTWTLSLRCVRTGAGVERLYLPLTPVQSIASISYFDADNQVQAADVDDFYFYGNEDWAYLEPKQGNNWPSTYDRLDAITITFVAGFGAAAAVPMNIKQAIRLIVAHWYRNRASVVTGTIVAEVPMSATALLGMSRKGWVA